MTTILPPADAFNDPFAKKATARKMRVAFDKWKRTEEGQYFYKRQMKVQDYMCAYCKVDLRLKHITVHIDHRIPLYEGGSNKTNNLLLTCRRCNLRKYTSVYGLPLWVEKRFQYRARKREDRKLESMRKAQQEQYDQLQLQAYEEELGYELRQRFRED